MALFEVRGLDKAFGENKLLRGLDLDVRAGEFLTIIGESGCGKSVLLKCMLGLLPIDRGTVSFDGQVVSGLPEPKWVPVRQRIGMLFQESALFDSMNVRDNVSYALREQLHMNDEDIDRRVSESLQLVSLPGIEQMWPADLSGGMRKRVALARAVAVRPEVVFYDEPTEGLDPINVTRVNRLLLALRDRLHITTVVVTHNMESAFGISDRVALVSEGRVIAEGPPAELRKRGDALVDAFTRNLDAKPARHSKSPPRL